MKKNLFATAALMAVALVSVPSVSQGAASVWFSAGGDGGAGTVLEIVAAPGANSIDVSMLANVTGVSLYSNNTTLTADGPVSVTAWNAVPPPGGAATPAGGLGVPGPGPIATNFGAATFSPPGYIGNGIDMGTLTLSFTGEEVGPTGITI